MIYLTNCAYRRICNKKALQNYKPHRNIVIWVILKIKVFHRHEF